MIRMPFIRENVKKRKDGTTVKYFEEVESYRINGKVRQRHIRSLGRDRDNPSNFALERVQFGYIATRLMQGDLSADDLMDMIDGMGHHAGKDDLERIGLFYDLKKNTFSLSLYRKRSSVNRKTAGSLEED